MRLRIWLSVLLMGAALAVAEPLSPTDKSVCFSNDTFVKLTIFLQETDEMVSRLTGQINHLQRSYDDLAMCIRIKAVEGKPAVECLGAVTI